MDENRSLTSPLPLAQHWRNSIRVCKLLHGLEGKQFPMALTASFCEVAVGYLGLLLSAWLLNALATDLNGGYLWGGLFLFLTAILGGKILTTFLRNRLTVYREAMAMGWQHLVNDKIMRMDFSLVDSPRLREIQERIEKDNDWGAGIYTILWQFDSLTRGIFQLIGAFVIGFPVLGQIWSNKNIPALGVLGASLCLAMLFIKVRLIKNGAYLEKLLADAYDVPEERANKENMIWALAVRGGYTYQDGKDLRLYEGQSLMEAYTLGRFSKYGGELRVKLSRLSEDSTGFSAGSGQLVAGLAYLTVALSALAGSLPVGTLVSSAGALANLTGGLLAMGDAAFEIALACRKQISTLTLLELADEMYRGKLPVEKRSDGEYEVEFSHVWFRYPGQEAWALQDFSLRLKVGKKIAIVGMNGSGKTTMIKLLCKLYEPTRGEILLNGVDIRKFREEEYRNLFSVVFQDLQLFSLRLGENVAGEEKYDRQKARFCLEASGFGERLNTLSGGLDSWLFQDYEDNGIEISGGEAQKIAIARALYKDAAFVLLDEPTAALDPKAEYEIYTGFDRIVGNKTAIYISHRLSACRFCDEIAVFDGGRLVQLGSHEELLNEREGKYWALWQAQARYYQ